MSDPGNYAGNGDRSLGQLVASATAEMSALVHDEIALAKAELRQDVKRGAVGGVAGVVMGVLFLASIPMFSFALAYWIHSSGLGLAWCFLIVGGAYIVLGALFALLAKVKFGQLKPPERSIASAKQTAAVLQNAKPHPRPAVLPGTARTAMGSTLADKAVASPPVRDEAPAVARSST
ncbi:phage holin family protein [Streptomyces fulvorobeus]|uniref:Transporter n=1 Tax=Streptomyces fulvorobeus TaxID=284028 RepID=A0A7J0C6Y8_9ACTN|nr:phage holin family protein [Streptomyces fulvorobeus]NYE41564.1 hypothetical protein [Streptomyces fulvorobeus]GFM97927.1 transporter [Streptomyces fulvorobeus]